MTPFSIQHSAFARRRLEEWVGIPVWVTTGEDLVLSKLLWAKEGGSLKQLADVRAILSSGKVAVGDYFERWVRLLDVQQQLDAARTERYGA